VIFNIYYIDFVCLYLNYLLLCVKSARLTVLDSFQHLLPDSERQVTQITRHMNQSSRTHPWIRLWDLDSEEHSGVRTAVNLSSDPLREEIRAAHLPFHPDFIVLENIYSSGKYRDGKHFNILSNTLTVNESLYTSCFMHREWSQIDLSPLETRRHCLSSSPPCLWVCVKELRCVCSSPPASPSSSASSAPLPPSVQWL